VKHPMIVRSAALRIAQSRIAASSQPDHLRIDDLSSDLADVVKLWGEGDDPDISPLEDAQVQIEELLDNEEVHVLDPDQIEGRAACVLFRAITEAGTDPAALDDPGFWRYVGLAHVWNFAAWRQPTAFAGRRSGEGAPDAPASLKSYVDGNRPHECVPARMYLRVRALGGLEHADLAWAVREGTDFWRSHILRVTVGEHPPIVRAMVRRQAHDQTRLLTDDLRELAKDLNRTLTNVVPALLDEGASEELVDELWENRLNQAREGSGTPRAKHGAGSDDESDGRSG